MVCPIREGHKVIGVLQCLNKEGSKGEINFSDDDEQLCQIISEFASVVLGNAINFD